MKPSDSHIYAEAAVLRRGIEAASAKPLPTRGLTPQRAEETLRDLRRERDRA